MINLDALLSAIQERKRLAEAATPGPWIEEYSSETGPCVIPADAQSTREFVARTQLYAAVFDAKHIAANSPAEVLRQTAADLELLDEYMKYRARLDEKLDDDERWHLTGQGYVWFKVIHRLAHAYAIPTEETE